MCNTVKDNFVCNTVKDHFVCNTVKDHFGVMVYRGFLVQLLLLLIDQGYLAG